MICGAWDINQIHQGRIEYNYYKFIALHSNSARRKKAVSTKHYQTQVENVKSFCWN
jgi:hypothetical protein